MTDKIAKRAPEVMAVSMGRGGVELTRIEEAFRFADAMVEAKMAPSGLNASGVMVTIQAGMELGFPPMMALRVLYPVNGRVGIMGEAAKALVRKHGLLATGTDIDIVLTGEGDNRKATCTARRKGNTKSTVREFTWAEAKRAGLTSKDTYRKWGDDMLGARSWGRLAKHLFSDVLLGMALTEELRDLPPEPVSVGQLEPPKGDDPIFGAVPSGYTEETSKIVTPTVKKLDMDKYADHEITDDKRPEFTVADMNKMHDDFAAGVEQEKQQKESAENSTKNTETTPEPSEAPSTAEPEAFDLPF